MDKIQAQISKTLTVWMESHPTLNTFKKVAARAGVGFGTVQRMKNGNGNVTASNLDAVAKAFGKTIAAFFTEDTEPKPIGVKEPAIIYAAKSDREKLVEQIEKALDALNNYGLVAVLEKAKEAAKEKTFAKQTLSSSA